MAGKRTYPLLFLAAGSIYLALTVAGCARTQAARKVEKSGFLKDYSILVRHKGDTAQLIYINTGVDWKRYDKVLLEPFTIWRVPGSKLEGLSQADADRLGNYFYHAVKAELQKDYTMVDKPWTGTLRMRGAVTEAEKSKVVLDMVTTIVPTTLVVREAERLAIGTDMFVGKATAEFEVRDAMTGELLGAGVSRKIGGTVIAGNKFSSWGDVKAAADDWSKRLRKRMADLRAGKDPYGSGN